LLSYALKKDIRSLIFKDLVEILRFVEENSFLIKETIGIFDLILSSSIF